jgi:hypothetical protein
MEINDAPAPQKIEKAEVSVEKFATPELTSTIEPESRQSNFGEKIRGVLRSQDIATPLETLRIRLNSRNEQKLTPLVNPDAVSALSQIGEGLEKLIHQPEISLEDTKREFSKHLLLLESLFQNIPQTSTLRENTDSLLSVGEAFSGVYTMNENLSNKFREADESKDKNESSELNAILHATNTYIIKIIQYINKKLEVLEVYNR